MGLGARGWGLAGPRAWPHALQNLAAGGSSIPHFGHGNAKDAPHSMQNFEFTGLSTLHVGQFITLFHLPGL